MRAVPLLFFALIFLQATWHALAEAPRSAAAVEEKETYKDERISIRIPQGSKVTLSKSADWDSYTIHMPSRGNQTLVLRIGGDAEALEISQQRAIAAKRADVARVGVEEVQGDTKFVLKEVSGLTETHMDNGVIVTYEFEQEMHLDGKVHPGWVSVGFGSVNGIAVMCRLSGPGHDAETDYMVAVTSLCEIKKR